MLNIHVVSIYVTQQNSALYGHHVFVCLVTYCCILESSYYSIGAASHIQFSLDIRDNGTWHFVVNINLH